MKAVVVSHGSIIDTEHARKIMKESDVIICADGGAEYALKCGVVPDVLIGDLDSLDMNTLDKIKDTECRILRYSREKDYTDTQLALEYAVKIGAEEIIMLGSIGDRVDHSLANIYLLIQLVHRKIKACIINEKNFIYLIDKHIKLNGNKGDVLSLIPISGDVHGIFTKGLKYGLSGTNICIGDPVGVSNVFLENDVEVSIESGLLLVIRSRD